MAAISVRGLTKRFGEVLAVDHLTFDVDPAPVRGRVVAAKLAAAAAAGLAMALAAAVGLVVRRDLT